MVCFVEDTFEDTAHIRKQRDFILMLDSIVTSCCVDVELTDYFKGYDQDLLDLRFQKDKISVTVKICGGDGHADCWTIHPRTRERKLKASKELEWDNRLNALKTNIWFILFFATSTENIIVLD